MARTSVSISTPLEGATKHVIDVIVMAAMGEEQAVDAKEAPKGS
jgi:hypothetical protein